MLSWLPRDLQWWEAGGPGSLVGGLMVLGSSEENLDMHLNRLLEPRGRRTGMSLPFKIRPLSNHHPQVLTLPCNIMRPPGGTGTFIPQAPQPDASPPFLPLEGVPRQLERGAHGSRPYPPPLRRISTLEGSLGSVHRSPQPGRHYCPCAPRSFPTRDPFHLTFPFNKELGRMLAWLLFSLTMGHG